MRHGRRPRRFAAPRPLTSGSGAVAFVRLRPHHLFCLLTYVGRGYSPGFVATMDAVAARLSSGVPARIVSGADDICAGLCPPAERHCERDSVTARDARALTGAAAILGRRLGIGDEIRFDAAYLADMRAAFRDDSTAGRAPCHDCPWFDLCTGVAAADFAGAKL